MIGHREINGHFTSIITEAGGIVDDKSEENDLQEGLFVLSIFMNVYIYNVQ
jgi:hypothetical protein